MENSVISIPQRADICDELTSQTPLKQSVYYEDRSDGPNVSNSMTVKNYNSKPRLLVYTRDKFPFFRVDVTELFGTCLSKEFALTWIAEREEEGSASSIVVPNGQEAILPSMRRGSPVRNAISAAIVKLKVLFRVAKGEWDLVQSRDAIIHALPMLLAARIGRARFTYWMSFPMAEGFVASSRDATLGNSVLKRRLQSAYGRVAAALLYRVVMPLSDHVFVQSDEMKRYVVEMGGASDRITSVPMGVNHTAFDMASVRRSEWPDPGAAKIFYMGAVDKGRRIDVVVDAARTLKESGRRVHLTLLAIGDSQDLARVRDMISSAKLEAVSTLLPRQPLTVALGWVLGADVCLSTVPDTPLLRLGTPTKVVEYISMGRPVVANPHPDHQTVIEATGAGLIADLDGRCFAYAIEKILDDPTWSDRALRGREWVVRNRSYEKLSRQVGDIYAGLLQDRGIS